MTNNIAIEKAVRFLVKDTDIGVIAQDIRLDFESRGSKRPGDVYFKNAIFFIILKSIKIQNEKEVIGILRKLYPGDDVWVPHDVRFVKRVLAGRYSQLIERVRFFLENFDEK